MPITYRGARLERHRVQSPFFAHYVFAKSGCVSGAYDAVPVFLDGDGNSWIRAGVAAEDPTPSEPIALDLLIADEACGRYVSRACAFGLARSDARCQPEVWTVDRYAEPAVASLAFAVNEAMPAGRPILLVGYSGGGLLASQLANRLPAVAGVITLGANLDLAAWVAHHGYAPEIVTRSLPSPFPLREGVASLHVFGALDVVSPASLAMGVLSPEAKTFVLDEADHTCCWARRWPWIRAAFQQRMSSSSRMRSSSALR